MIFAVEVESDQETPEIGEYFDAANDKWTWLDIRLAAVLDSHDKHIPDAVKEIL